MDSAAQLQYFRSFTKMLLAALALGAFAQGALAGEPDCHAIDSTSGRLACYDVAFPPRPKTPVITDHDKVRAEYKDPLIAEDARIAGKLKNICRGC